MASKPKNCATALASTRRRPLKSVMPAIALRSAPWACITRAKEAVFCAWISKNVDFFCLVGGSRTFLRENSACSPVSWRIFRKSGDRAYDKRWRLTVCKRLLLRRRPRLRRRPSQRLRPPLVCFSQFACQPWNRTIFQNRSMPRTNSCGFFRSIRAAFTSSS